jgi:hypothetical protein
MILHKKIWFYIFMLKPERWQKVAKFKGAEYFRKALFGLHFSSGKKRLSPGDKKPNGRHLGHHHSASQQP